MCAFHHRASHREVRGYRVRVFPIVSRTRHVRVCSIVSVWRWWGAAPFIRGVTSALVRSPPNRRTESDRRRRSMGCRLVRLSHSRAAPATTLAHPCRGNTARARACSPVTYKTATEVLSSDDDTPDAPPRSQGPRARDAEEDNAETAQAAEDASPSPHAAVAALAAATVGSLPDATGGSAASSLERERGTARFRRTAIGVQSESRRGGRAGTGPAEGSGVGSRRGSWRGRGAARRQRHQRRAVVVPRAALMRARRQFKTRRAWRMWR